MMIEKIKLPNNWVCVMVDDSNEYINLPNGEKLKLDISYEPEKHSQTTGVVAKVCEHLFYRRKFNPSMPWDVENEVRAGDVAIFHFLTIRNAQKDGKVMYEDGVKYVFIHYSEIYCVVRGGNPMAVNGWILVEPEEKELPKTTFHIPDIAHKDSETRGIVRCAGAKIKDYHDYDCGEDPDVNVGDRITFRPSDSIPLQYEFHSTLGKKLYRMQRKDVLAILTEV